MILRCQNLGFLLLIIYCVTSDPNVSEHRMLRILSNRYSKTTITTTTTVKMTSTATTRSNLSPRQSKVTDDSSIIHFPSSSSSENSGKTGDKCVTFYGRIGTCQPTHNCFQERPLFQTQLLAHCGFVDRKPLICCPEEAVVNLGSKRPDRPKLNKQDAVTSIYFQDPVEPTKELFAGNPAPAQPKPQVVPTLSETEAVPTQQKAEVAPTNVKNGNESTKSKPEFPSPTETAPIYQGTNPNPHSKPEQSKPPTQTQPLGTNYEKHSESTVASDLKPTGSTSTISNNDILNNSSDLQQTCGVYNNLEGGDESWPWIVSIGHRSETGTVRWHCLGSLITREHILTSGLCLQKEANVIALGVPLLGTSTTEDITSLDLVSISQILVHEKFISPFLYKNVGLIQINPVTVSETVLPICFPFLASVLDIIHFQGYKAKTLGFQFPVASSSLKFGAEEYRIMGNEQCSRIFEKRKADILNSFPRGLGSDNVCALKSTPTSICQAPGAPLVLLDEASSSNVIIGIASGDPTCSKFNRQLVTFTRMNSFSTWVRERVAKFPTPPPCYY